MSLIGFEGVACLRGGRLLFEALDLAIAPGEAVHVTGANGTGKSSLLRLAAGLLAPAAGRIERPATIALADEALALDRERTLGEALGWWAQRDGGDLAAALDAFGLTDLAPVPVRLLSTGQARRARLARVAASGAKLWLLDEPLNGLDADGISRLAAALSKHISSGGGVIVASHVALGGAWRELALGQ
ncbi:heme ABC exporter ATP-binding protein CcmA [Sphingomonas sp.]|uniref:heme ABC exporter ATP-binding protein CcmA n=1 Tax=Sphingomonas sp. TaxID=28214 RepID=UPI00286C0410|nr:heme ABC exporter ATP-binding protein CcmA [Sphingomonas sp.]